MNQVELNGTIYNVPQSLGPGWTPSSPGVTVLQSGLPQAGTAAGNPLTAPLTAPFQPTMAQLAATPGYQFTLGQGLQATQNAYAAQGLGTSGPALKGAANYAEGLAATTYQQQFQNYLQQNQQIANILGAQVQQGQAAAAGTGAGALTTGSTAGQSLLAAGTAQAAGTVGVANALTGATSTLGNAGLLYALTGGAPGIFGSQGNPLLPGGTIYGNTGFSNTPGAFSVGTQQ
jgi:hypothetical protein